MSSSPRLKIKEAATAGRWSARPQKEVFLTGCEELNRLTGGIPRASIVEINGTASAGRTALVYAMMGSLLGSGHIVAYIDATNAFDPRSAAAAGIPIDRLLWVRGGGGLKNTMIAADTVLHAGGFSLIVLDLVDVEADKLRTIPQSNWFRFQRVIEKQSATLLVMSRYSLTKTCAGLVIDCRFPQPVWLGRKLPVLSEIKSEILVNRPAPRRSSSVLLKSYFWLEQKNVRRRSFSLKG